MSPDLFNFSTKEPRHKQTNFIVQRIIANQVVIANNFLHQQIMPRKSNISNRNTHNSPKDIDYQRHKIILRHLHLLGELIPHQKIKPIETQNTAHELNRTKAFPNYLGIQRRKRRAVQGGSKHALDTMLTTQSIKEK
jgi:hypothetical protein